MSRSAIHVFIAGLLLVVLMFFQTIGFLGPVLDFGRVVTDIFSRPFAAIMLNLKNVATVIFSVKDLYVQNKILSDQVNELSLALALAEQAKVENEVLREALGFLEESNFELIPAQVITFDPLQPDRTAIINRGSNHGVRVGDSVIVSGGVLVGSVISVSNGTSEVEPITSSNITVNARIASGDTTGIVKGEHGLGLLFDLISQTAVVNTGERVITSGLGGVYPPNLLIGTINEIRSPESELFQKASVVPAAPLRDLKIVFVLKR